MFVREKKISGFSKKIHAIKPLGTTPEIGQIHWKNLSRHAFPTPRQYQKTVRWVEKGCPDELFEWYYTNKSMCDTMQI